MKKRRKKLSRIIAVFLSVCFAIGLLSKTQLTVFADGQTVTLTVIDDEKAEIAFAVGDTMMDYSKFREHMLAELSDRGITSDRVNFMQFDAMSSTTQNTFNWWTYDHTNTNSATINENTHTYIDVNSNKNTSNAYDNTNFSTGTTPATSNTHILTTDNGATMDFYGYGASGFKDFQYLPNNQATKKTIQFTIHEGSAYDALDGVGFLINTSITGTSYDNQVINGYLLFLQYTSGGKGSSIKLFKLTNVSAKALHNTIMSTYSKDADFSSGAELLASANTSYGNFEYRKMKIEVMPSYIKLWYNGSSNNNVNYTFTNSDLVKWTYNSQSVTEYPITKQFDSVDGKNVFRGGYGPLISYRSHSCGQLTHFTLSNLSMTSEYVRSLTEIVREPSWDENKASFLVNLNESPIEDFSDQFTTSEIINRLADDDITYIGWGGNQNSEGSASFVEAVGNHSGFVNIDNFATSSTDTEQYSNTSEKYNNQIKALANCVVNRLAKPAVDGNHYTFLDTDTFRFSASGANLDNGLWSVGYSATQDGEKTISTYPDLRNAPFTDIGWYEIYYDGDTITPKAYIRIHKAPEAHATAAINTDTHKIEVDTSQSFDPDYPDAENKGITSTVIEYKNVKTSSEWSTTAPTSVDPDQTWMIRVTVTDSEGASDSIVKSVIETTQSTHVVPYGSFTLDKTTYYNGIDNTITLTDGSYSPDGDETHIILNYEIKDNTTGNVVWSSATEGNAVGLRQSKSISLAGFGAGSYTVSLVAENYEKVAAKVSRTFKVVNAYEITYNVNGGNTTIAHQYKIQGTDKVLSSIAPSRSGFTFAGWSGNDGNTYQPGATYTTDAALQLTAIWEENFVYSAKGEYVVYDGQPHSITVTVTHPESGATITYGESSDNITSTTNISKTNVGTYPVYFKLSNTGFREVTNSRNIEIIKRTLELTMFNQTIPYTGNALANGSLVVSNIVEGEENAVNAGIVYQYFMDADCTIPTNSENSGAAAEYGAPVNEGTYYVKAIYAATANYNAAESNLATLTIQKYTVHFNVNNVGEAPEDIEHIVPGTTIASPGELTHADYIFLGWYKTATGDELWDFDTEPVNADGITIYAHWKAKSEYEVRYTDPTNPDEWKYGTLEEALNSDPAPKDIIIQNDVNWPDAIDDPTDPNYPKNNSIPEGTTITIGPGVTVTNDEDIDVDGKIINNGTIDNNGSITGDGELDNNGTIDNADGTIDLGKTKNEEGGIINGGTIGGNVDNDGTIDGSTITGNVDNDGTIDDSTIGQGGTVTGGDITGDTINNGTITGSTIHDNIDNTNGTIDDSTIDNGGTVTGGNVTDSTIKPGGIVENAHVGGDTNNDGTIKDSDISGNVDNTEGTIINGTINQDGNVTGGDIKGDTTNNGNITGGDIDGTINNNGKVTDSEIEGTVNNNGDITGSDIDGIVNNNGDVTDSKIEGTVNNNGDISGSSISGTVNNDDEGVISGSDISGTVDNDGTISGSSVSGDIDNDGVIDNSYVSGDVDNKDGELSDSTIGGDTTVTGGDITGDTINNGTITDSTIHDDVDNTNGVISDSKIDDDGTVSGGSIEGSTENNGTITGSDIDGSVTNNGTISDSDVSADVDNNGTINNSNVNGDVDNEDGELIDSTIGDDSTVTGGDIRGNTVNNGTITDSTLHDDVDNTNGVIKNLTIDDGITVTGGDAEDITVGKGGTLDGANVSGETINEGTIKNSNLSDNVLNQGSIENSNVSGTIDNFDGVIEGGKFDGDAVISGGEFSGEIESNIPNGTEDLQVVNQGEKDAGLEVKDETATVVENLLEDNEKALVKYGSDVTIFVTVEDVTDYVSEVNKNLVSGALSGNSKVGAYLDINLFKQVTGYEPVQITETDGYMISFTVKVPKELINIDSRVERTYSLYREHDGKVEMITGTYNSADQTISFKSDKFSIYAIVYTDTEIKVEKVDEEPTPAQIVVPETTKKVEEEKVVEPATGDNMNVKLISLMMFGSAFAVLYLTLKKKRASTKKTLDK